MQPARSVHQHDVDAARTRGDERVVNDSRRVGARLEGPALERRITSELLSEPTVPGGIQVTGAGVPTILLADRPVTGGYPVVAIVDPGSLDLVAQVRPGQVVRFRHAR